MSDRRDLTGDKLSQVQVLKLYKRTGVVGNFDTMISVHYHNRNFAMRNTGT
jgi:hypothetical protein